MRKILKTLTLTSLLISISSFASAININQADAATISSELKGIGTTKAEAIVKFREEHGPFSEPNDLLIVPGIGPKVLEMIQDQLTFEETEVIIPAATVEIEQHKEHKQD